MLKGEGFYPLTQLHRIRLNGVTREFYDSIDTIEITRQLSGKPATEVLTLPMVLLYLALMCGLA